MYFNEGSNKDKTPRLKKNRTGFTLVELLVVLAILGLMATIVTAVFSDVRARSRDSRRVSDINALHKAMAMYLDTHSSYMVAAVPAPGIAIDGNDFISQSLDAENILNAKVADPRAGQDINGEIFNYYYRTDPAGITYTLTYCLETDSVSGKVQGCGNSENY